MNSWTGAVLALEQGFDGTALRQLAGLIKPTLSDLGLLPQRAFAEVGLPFRDKNRAVDLLIARQDTLTCPTVLALITAIPDFSKRWRTHLAYWAGIPAGSYVDMAEFVHFAVEDLYEQERLVELHIVFQLLEKLLAEGDQEARDLIGLGFFETLQCFASWRPYGNQVFEQFLGPMSKECWQEIKAMWAGKASLMDVIRSEREPG